MASRKIFTASYIDITVNWQLPSYELPTNGRLNAILMHLNAIGTTKIRTIRRNVSIEITYSVIRKSCIQNQFFTELECAYIYSIEMKKNHQHQQSLL